MKNRLLVAVVFIVSFSQVQAQIYINEFQALNGKTIADSYGEFDDWIELYNTGDSIFYLDQIFISDDGTDLTKWQIRDSSKQLNILPGEYLLLWADDQPIQGPKHLGFKLSSEGESIIITNFDSVIIIDEVTYFPEQYADISYGRIPGSLQNWSYFSRPTPGFANEETVFFEKTEKPVISAESGFFIKPQYITISADDSAAIYYTLDASKPSIETASIYKEPILIDTTLVLRAMAKKKGLLASTTETRTFIFGDLPHLPVIFLNTNHDNFWGPSGILESPSKGWEKPISFEFIDHDDNARIRMDAGVKVHAPDGRLQQSLRLYARSEYGEKYFNYAFFKQKELDRFKRLVLRNGGNDGLQIPKKSHIRDLVIQQLFFEQNNNYPISAFQPVNVYLNGRYWGIYNLRERQDEYYIQDNFPYDGPLDLLERAFDFPGNRNAIIGDWQQYDLMKNFIDQADLSVAESYEYVKTLMDISQFTDYWIFEVFVGNFDWLSNNMRFWKPQNGTQKWRWALWDVDHGLGMPLLNYGNPAWNTLDWSTAVTGDRTGSGSNTILIRNLLENGTFKIDFINRFADLLNTTFLPENIHQVTNELAAAIEPDVPKHINRWRFNTFDYWQRAVEGIKNYASARPEKVQNHIMEKFNLSGFYRLNIILGDSLKGGLKLNSLDIKSARWSGVYFNNIPIKLSAKPAVGYLFDYWLVGNEQLFDSTFIVTFSDTTEISLFFKTDTIPQLVINEINYNSANDFDAGDWVEFYNPKYSDFDVSGWIIKDSDNMHAFRLPAGTIIQAGDFLTVVEDYEEFEEYFPDVKNVISGMDFGFSGSEDQIRLYRPDGRLIDSVAYSDDDPWPSDADGKGFTMELNDPYSDNLLAENWYSSKVIGGTPGAENSVVSGLLKPLYKPERFWFIKNYPNPFNNITKIKYQVAEASQVTIDIFNTRGQKVHTLINKFLIEGEYNSIWLPQQFSSGIYYIRLSSNKKTYKTVKTVLLK